MTVGLLSSAPSTAFGGHADFLGLLFVPAGLRAP